MRSSRELIVHPAFEKLLHGDPAKGAAPRWEHLPPLVLQKVALHLSPRDLARLQGVSRECRELAGDERLWKRLCLQRFNVRKDREPESWKALYRFNHELFVSLFSAGSAAAGPGMGPLNGPIVMPLHA